jgi:hypothetical protein
MKRLIYILFFISSAIVAQTDLLNLKDNYAKLTLKQTTIEDLENYFGKPDKKSSCKSCGCMKYEFPLKTFSYEKLGMTIGIERTKEDKTYRITWIEFSNPSSIIFGKNTKIGNSTYDQTFEDIGNPTTKFDSPIYGMTAQYFVKEKNIKYVLNFDLNTKMLTKITLMALIGVSN